MRVVIAMDSFKGSLSSIKAGNAVREGVKRVFKDAEIVVCPVADGGEGTVAALSEGMNGHIEKTNASDPLGRNIECEYGIIPEEKTAVIEMAAAAGLTLLETNERNPLRTSTYGVGELIKDAVRKGCRHFIIGIGGSATNDGGVGMLQALGFEFLDENGKQVARGAEGLSRIKTISGQKALPELAQCSFSIACDVENPLCGANGCSAVFAPQKGADQAMIENMDKWLLSYAEKVRNFNPAADSAYPGAGAAGGLGFAFLSFLGGKLEKGIELIMRETQIENDLSGADIVVTGEGRLDAQSVMGKTPIGIAKMAKKYKLPVIAFAGGVEKGAKACNLHGIDAFFSITRGVCTLEEAMDPDNAYVNLADAAEQAFRLFKAGGSLNGKNHSL